MTEPGLLTSIMNGLEDAAKWVVNLLPGSPFQAITTGPIQEFLGYIGWLVPVAECLAILQLWITAVSGWYVYQAIARMTKLAE